MLLIRLGANFIDFFRESLEIQREYLFERHAFDVGLKLDSGLLHEFLPVTICNWALFKLLDQGNWVAELGDFLGQFDVDGVFLVLLS